MALGAAIFVFALGCVAILGVFALVSGWRRAGELEPGDDEPYAYGEASEADDVWFGHRRGLPDPRSAMATAEDPARAGRRYRLPGGAGIMSLGATPIRVLQSFPHKIGAARICTTAWYQAAGAAEAGADVLVMPGAVHRPLPAEVRVRPTLARGKLRIPYKALGRMRACSCTIGSWRARCRAGDQIDIVHTWPMGARETLRPRAGLASPPSWSAPTPTRASPTRPCATSASASGWRCRPTRACLQRRHPAPRGGGVRAGRSAAVPVGLRRQDVPGPRVRERATGAPPLRLRRDRVPSAGPTPRRDAPGSPCSSSACARSGRASTSRSRRG